MKSKHFRDMEPNQVLVVTKLTGLGKMRNPPDIGDKYIFKVFTLVDPFSASSVHIYDEKRKELLCFSPSISKNLETLDNYRNKKINLVINEN